MELKNLIAKREDGSCITGDVTNHTESQVIFESDRFEEIEKNSLKEVGQIILSILKTKH